MGPWILASMFIIGGGLFTALGWWNLASLKRKRAAWVAVQAEVVDLAAKQSQESRTLYAPVYKYVFNGGEYTATSNVASLPAEYEVGDRIRILVNPADAHDTELMSGGGSMFTYGMMAFGIFLLAIGVLLAWLAAAGLLTVE